MVNIFLLDCPDTVGHRKFKQGLLDFSHSATFSIYYYAKVMFSSFKQGFLFLEVAIGVEGWS